jgi:polyisoprenoid-binding protein YceI
MKNVNKLIAVLGLVGLASTVVAEPKIYVSDPDHTFARFSYNHLGFTTQSSRFNDTSAKVVLDQEAKTGSVDATIDMTSVDTGSTSFDEHIQAADFLDTAKFPEATFKSTKVIFDGDKPSKVEGILAIKGISKPVTLTVTSFQAIPHPMQKKDALGANAYTVIKRSDFGAGKYAPAVSDEVRIDIAIEALAEEPTKK